MMHIYHVEWYNENDFGVTYHTDIIFTSPSKLSRKERISQAEQMLHYKCYREGIDGIDVGIYDKVSAHELKDQVLYMGNHRGIV